MGVLDEMATSKPQEGHVCLFVNLYFDVTKTGVPHPRKALLLVMMQVGSWAFVTKYASIFTIQRLSYIKQMLRNSLVWSFYSYEFWFV